jgi:hypothetical protein
MIEHQYAWQNLNHHYNNLSPEHKSIIPPPPKAPILESVKPFERYISENTKEEDITEAREAVDLLTPDDVEALMKPTDSEPMQRIKPYYEKALPGIQPEWVPIMARADVLSMALKNKA